MHYFHYQKNSLFCEDMSMDKLAEEYGTPLYIYSYQTMSEHYQKIASAFQEVNPLICYSVKANSNIALLKELVQLGSGLDIVSGGELYRALKAECLPEKIVYASVGKTDRELREGMDAKILSFNVESIAELIRLNEIAADYSYKPNVALRVNPDVDAMTHEYITTAKKKAKFGIDLKTAKELFLTSKLKYQHVNINGIHIHIGSQIVSPEPYLEAFHKIEGFIQEIRKNGEDIEYFDMGGGFGIIYDTEKPQTAEELAEKSIDLLKRIKTKIIIEPGRFIMGNAGVLITKAIYVKESIDKRFIIVNGAMNDLIRPSLYQAYHQILPVNPREGLKDEKKADIVGPVCESGDFLGKDRELWVHQGDLIAIMGTGAYGFSMSSNYNSRLKAAEVLIKDNQSRLIRKRENYEDLIRLEIF